MGGDASGSGVRIRALWEAVPGQLLFALLFGIGQNSGLPGRLAQSVRALASHARGHRFESCIAHHSCAEVAEW